MGFNTSVVIMNDTLGDIERDEEFGKNLACGITEVEPGKPVTVSSKGAVRAAVVVETHHANAMHCIAVGANVGRDLGYCGDWAHWDADIKMLAELARQRGYKLVKQ